MSFAENEYEPQGGPGWWGPVEGLHGPRGTPLGPLLLSQKDAAELAYGNFV